MKKINLRYRLLIAGIAVLLLAACDEGDKIVDGIFETETRGAVLRTVNVISNEIPIGSADSTFAVELEVQDQENGSLVQSVEAWLSFVDNSIAEDGTDLSTDEVLAETLDASTFTIGEFGLPRFTYSITLPDIVSVLPISDSDVDGSDQFAIRFELVLVDGRRFSQADNNGNITGSFFNSPFLYTALVTCPTQTSDTRGLDNQHDRLFWGWMANR